MAREDPESRTGWKEISELSEERWFDFFEWVEDDEGGVGPGPGDED